MNIEIKNIGFCLNDLIEFNKIRIKNSSINFYYKKRTNKIKENINILYLFEFLDEKFLGEQIQKKLENEYDYKANSDLTIINLLSQGILVETILFYIMELKIPSLDELKLKNKWNIENMDEEDFLEYCYPIIVEKGFNINEGRSICLKNKKNIHFIYELSTYLNNEK